MHLIYLQNTNATCPGSQNFRERRPLDKCIAWTAEVKYMFKFELVHNRVKILVMCRLPQTLQAVGEGLACLLGDYFPAYAYSIKTVRKTPAVFRTHLVLFVLVIARRILFKFFRSSAFCLSPSFFMI